MIARHQRQRRRRRRCVPFDSYSLPHSPHRLFPCPLIPHDTVRLVPTLHAIDTLCPGSPIIVHLVERTQGRPFDWHCPDRALVSRGTGVPGLHFASATQGCLSAANLVPASSPSRDLLRHGPPALDDGEALPFDLLRCGLQEPTFHRARELERWATRAAFSSSRQRRGSRAPGRRIEQFPPGEGALAAR